VTSWAASAQGPYPSGSAVAMPDQRFAFPSPQLGARDQSLRLIVRPSVWGRSARVRFTNAFGTAPLRLDGAFVGLQHSAASLAPGSNQPIRFGGRSSVTIPPGGDIWSDAVALPFAGDPDTPLLAGRKLAVSFHVVGESGPMTWHAKAMQTSYASLPGAGSRGQEEHEGSFPNSTTGWFFVDAVDMMMPSGVPLVVCLGDSITDGTGSTLNGDDRWPDILQRRLNTAFPNGVAVVDAGIGANQITGPAEYSLVAPVGGGPAAVQRIDRDVISLSGVKTIIWFEGINDISNANNASVEKVTSGLRQGVARLRASIPGVRIIGATITTALGAGGNHGSADEDGKRRAINDFIRTSGLYDATTDFDAAVFDPATGGLKAEFVPGSTTGGAGDRLHPNRAGYLAMANTIDLTAVVPGLPRR
jgi:lysophospholipase L1-like esterase